MDALLGYSGFVGRNLLAQHSFNGKFGSSDTSALCGASFDTLVCAAAPGSMFHANRSPYQDAARIKHLISSLRDARARRFILISSIATIGSLGSGEDESTTKFEHTLAYGRNRRTLEHFCQVHFPNCLIVRLPALFGDGLRKNLIFDMLNPLPSMLTDDRFKEMRDRAGPKLRQTIDELYEPKDSMFQLDRIALGSHRSRGALEAFVQTTKTSAAQFHNPRSSFQFYDLTRLWADIIRASDAGLSLVHLVTEPISASRIYRHVLGTSMPSSDAALHHEDVHTCHANIWARDSPYLEDADEVLRRLSGFCNSRKLT